MLTKRIIPCLDIKNGRTVKGVNFKELRDAGDPVELAELYSLKGADELVFLDITATDEKRKTVQLLVERVAERINIPFTVGGGISSESDAYNLLQAGADKIAINTSAVRNPDIIDQLARAFGSQCIVLAVDAKNINNEWKVHLVGGKVPTELDLFDWTKEAQERGAGEVLFTSMDHDGVQSGFANAALARLSKLLTIPIIASGGAGCEEDFFEVFHSGHADAALAASVFHFNKIDIPSLKRGLAKKGIPCRL